MLVFLEDITHPPPPAAFLWVLIFIHRTWVTPLKYYPPAWSDKGCTLNQVQIIENNLFISVWNLFSVKYEIKKNILLENIECIHEKIVFSQK